MRPPQSLHIDHALSGDWWVKDEIGVRRAPLVRSEAEALEQGRQLAAEFGIDPPEARHG